ncbi:MAG: insulinase family protein [Candidatus Omnitrophica bacterium]|nr:insulinase family protein [Candidatus Omnitrophota bacterium]
MYKLKRLSNGLRIVTNAMEDRESIALGFWIGVGGRHEQSFEKGAAHFFEHIVFKGSRKYGCDQIKEQIEGVGGALNAFTSEEQTCFFAKIPAKHFEKTFDILADMVFYPLITPQDVRKERTVILEEIKMYRDQPQYFVFEILDRLVWPNHPLGESLAGTHETVSKLTPTKLRNFYDNFYHNENIVVACCGKVSPNRIIDVTKEKLGKIKRTGVNDFVRVESTQNSPRFAFHHKNIEQMHLALGMLGYNENQQDRYVLNLLSVILGGNMSSRLFVELREKRGLAYSVSCSSKSMHDTGIFFIRAGVDNQKIVKSMDVILKELRRIKRFGVTQNEFQRAKDYLMGQLLLGLEDTMEHMLWIGESVIAKNKTKTLREVIRDFNKISKDDIKRVAKEVISEKRFNLALVGPINEQQEKKLRSMVE